MLGIEDPWVWSAYLLCLLSALLCVIYGAINWNRGDEPVEPDDKTWAEHEKQVEQEI
jgi:hypothetical protein